MVLSDYLSLFPGATRENERFMVLAETVLRQADAKARSATQAGQRKE